MIRATVSLFVLVTALSGGSALAFPLDTNNFYAVGSGAGGAVGTNLPVGNFCNAGDVIVTGICYSTSGADGFLTAIGDNNGSPEKYLCNWYVTNGSATFHAQAICAHP